MDASVVTTDELSVCKAGGTAIINRRYITIKPLGCGTFGSVVLCIDVADSRLYAVKCLRKSQVVGCGSGRLGLGRRTPPLHPTTATHPVHGSFQAAGHGSLNGPHAGGAPLLHAHSAPSSPFRRASMDAGHCWVKPALDCQSVLNQAGADAHVRFMDDNVHLKLESSLSLSAPPTDPPAEDASIGVDHHRPLPTFHIHAHAGNPFEQPFVFSATSERSGPAGTAGSCRTHTHPPGLRPAHGKGPALETAHAQVCAGSQAHVNTLIRCSNPTRCLSGGD